MADPAFRGFVETTFDALLIFEGCRRGLLPKISRRLQEFEKRALVVSGAIFVFDEEETGIKRWTDGLSWSPSRTLSNFLVYRELDKKPGSRKGVPKDEPGEDEDDFDGSGKSKHAHRLMGGLTSKADPVEEEEPIAGSSKDDRPGSARPQSARKRTLSEAAASLQLDRARERALVGSLTSSARFRPDGLVKKTISLNGLHLIGYYRIEDVTSGRLRTPSSLPEIASLQIFHKFLLPSLFRVPPIVEMGPDGTLQYKGESDTPLSPISASSQGFPTPGMSQASHPFFASFFLLPAYLLFSHAEPTRILFRRPLALLRPPPHPRQRLGLWSSSTGLSSPRRHRHFPPRQQSLRPLLDLHPLRFLANSKRLVPLSVDTQRSPAASAAATAVEVDVPDDWRGRQRGSVSG